MQTQVCSTCRTPKTIDKFPKNRKQCKSCVKIRDSRRPKDAQRWVNYYLTLPGVSRS